MPRSRDHPTSRGSKTEAVMEFIKAHRGRVVDACTVADSIGLDRKVTATLMARLARKGRILKVGRGRYSTKGTRLAMSSTRARTPIRAKDGWKKAYDGIWDGISKVLGPAAKRLRKRTEGDRASGSRKRTERTIIELKEEFGGRLALDIVQPILEDIFGENGREMAMRLCLPGGGEG